MSTARLDSLLVTGHQEHKCCEDSKNIYVGGWICEGLERILSLEI